MDKNVVIHPRILEIINRIIRSEGGYVNDPRDLGGATKFGITAETLGHWRRLNRKATPEEVQELTKEEARLIYYKQYYLRPNIDECPEDFQYGMMDSYVLSGWKAVRELQRMLNRVAKSKVLKEDGQLGHNTFVELDRYFNKNAQTTIDAFGLSMCNYYIRIALARKANRAFLKGWINRRNKFISEGRQVPTKRVKEILNNWKATGV